MNPALAREVKNVLATLNSFLGGLDVDLDPDNVGCEVLVKKNRMVGCKIVCEIDRITEPALWHLIRFVERTGQGEIKFNGTMTKATVIYRLSFDQSNQTA